MKRKRFICIIIFIVALSCFTGCDEKNTLKTAENVPSETTANPFAGLFVEGNRIDLPEVPAGEWDEDEPIQETTAATAPTVEQEAPKEHSSPVGGNDLPEVPGGEWDEDEPESTFPSETQPKETEPATMPQETKSTEPIETRPAETDSVTMPDENSSDLPEVSGEWD